jgi:spermidine/putrescine transport system substrate-binding protein
MSSRQRPPLSPEAAAVVRAMSAGRLSRRSLLSGAGALGLGSVLAACGAGASTATTPEAGAGGLAKPTPAADLSDTENVVNWANWTLYLDKDASSKSYPTLAQFEKITGIRATYAEDIEDNDSYDGKIRGQLRQGQDIGKDVIVFTDWMASRVVKAGWAQKLDKAVHIPNAANIRDSLKDVEYDPGRNYSLTWQSGYTGLGWNIEQLQKLTGKTELRTVDELWDPRLKGRIEILSEMRDTVGLILLSQGVPIDQPFGRDKVDTAVGALEKQLASTQIRQVRGNSYKADLVSGDAVAVIGWSGDLFQLNNEARGASPGIKDLFGFAVPESGGVLWSDNLLIPIGSPHKTNAETLMNYYYDPKIAAQVAAYVNYICPVKGAQTEITKLSGVSPDIVNSPYIFPDEAQLKKVHPFRTLSAAEEKDFVAAFQRVLGA